MTSKAVLITGCSTGIGRTTAEHLAQKGWTVYATARRPDSIADLEQKGCRTLALDVTDEDSMRAAVRTVEDAEGAVGVLVNNAGYSQSGAVEEVPMDQVRRQFETNVFGLLRMCQLTSEGPYAKFNTDVATKTVGAYEGRGATGPETVAKRIERAISRRRPGTRYPITAGARLLLGVRKLLPDRGWDALMRTQFKPPRG